jgi:prophage tail gpP-like protein
MPWPNPSEVATLTVNGTDYRNWETVWVKHQLMETPAFSFRFSCSEGMPLARNLAALQIKPGDACTIELAGLPAFNGRVMTRQVFYDAKRHHIEIMGETNSEVMNSSVVHETGEWKAGTTFEQIVRDVLKPLGVNLKVEGGALPATKTDRPIRANDGESAYRFIDNLLRSSGLSGFGVAFTSNPTRKVTSSSCLARPVAPTRSWKARTSLRDGS